jgi:hypothetical protein
MFNLTFDPESASYVANETNAYRIPQAQRGTRARAIPTSSDAGPDPAHTVNGAVIETTLSDARSRRQPFVCVRHGRLAEQGPGSAPCRATQAQRTGWQR